MSKKNTPSALPGTVEPVAGDEYGDPIPAAPPTGAQLDEMTDPENDSNEEPEQNGETTRRRQRKTAHLYEVCRLATTELDGAAWVMLDDTLAEPEKTRGLIEIVKVTRTLLADGLKAAKAE